MGGNEVLIHDRMMAASTVLNDDETFSFCYFDCFSDFTDFERNAKDVLRCHVENSRPWEDRDPRDDMIHYSSIPWVRITSLTHSRKFRNGDSIPKIIKGKFSAVGQTIQMPLSVEVHHALMDGLHLGKFLRSSRIT